MTYKNQFSLKIHLLTKYIKLKDVTLKTEAQIKYKQYRTLLSTLMKESKRYYFRNYFQNNLNKSTWTGIILETEGSVRKIQKEGTFSLQKN